MIEAVPFVRVPVGWMRCVACSDYRRIPGQMWLGLTRGRSDEFVACPECKGTGQVPRYKHFDTRTGQEIDYEKPGQTFIYLGKHKGV